MATESAAMFRRYRAPQEDGQTLIDPSWNELPAVIERNRARMDGVCYDVSGRCLSELAKTARRRLIEQAVSFTGQYRDTSVALASLAGNSQSELRNPKSFPLVLSGHQPQLFHPGVWYKNFVLGSLAKKVGGVGIHFLIDSDLCRSVSIRVPTGTPRQPRSEIVSFDLPGPEVPYEERAIRDRELFASFGQRVTKLVQPLLQNPMIDECWPLVNQAAEQSSNIGLALARGRHQLEATWQNDTLELPQSAVCQLPEFAWFVAHLLANLPKFRAAYNHALAAYRTAHRLRNRAQPVPDLAKSDDWLEAPLWMWSADDPERRPLFARQVGGEIEISDRHQRTFRLSLSAGGNAVAAAEQLLALAQRGIKIRTRALATTLFARLVLGDVFLHGIGGAKYDQVTNLMAREFFGIDLPEFATVSATLRLPLGRSDESAASGRNPQAQLRELRYHPERFFAADGLVAGEEMSKVNEIIAAKRHWVETARTPANAKERHLGITSANEALQVFAGSIRQQIEERTIAQEERRRTDAVLNSREYAFCLYPRATFERLILDGPTQGT